MFKSLTLSALTLIACVLFPYVSHAAPTEWQLTMHKTYFFNTTFFTLTPGNVDINLRQGAMDVTSIFNFFVNAVSEPTPLSDIYHDAPFTRSLCVAGNCFINLSGANLFLAGTPHIEGVASDSGCCSVAELSFDGWFSNLPAGYWENPLLPAIPADLRDITSGEFVRRSALPADRILEFGTYDIRQVPEPSTLLLLGVGVIALIARFRRLP